MNRIVTVTGLALLASVQAIAQTPPGAAPAAPLPGAPAAPPGFEPPPADELPLAVATAWAEATLAACKANGYLVTATYMNNAYGVKLVLRSDGARAGTVDVGRRKAYTVIKSGMSSGDFAVSVGIKPGARMQPPVPGQPFGLPPGPNPDPNMIVAAGGLQIKVADKVVGAVSVSGAPGGEKDTACAEAGLAKVADQLK